jgi:DNA-binding transcriptional MerR regulator
MAETPGKSDQAFRTIGELAADLGVPQHILRYWESRFPQLKPLQRAGNRRYYRPADVLLAKRIHRLLNQDGYTIRGVQQLLASGASDSPQPAVASAPAPAAAPERPAISLGRLRAVRRHLAAALEEATV